MHTLPKLEYEYNSLEPFIDEKTMIIHHTKHHQTYVDKLNAALEKHPELQKKSAEELIKDLNKIPEDIRNAVRNHGGGHVNHSMFWKLLKKNVRFKGEVADEIKNKFGGFDKFKEEFSKAVLGIFGSGWGWLVVNGGKLEIVTTPNQDNPISMGKIPILGIDMWEHSWYIKHNANKSAYVEDFFHIINWEEVNKIFKNDKE